MILSELADAVACDPADVAVVLAWHEHEGDEIAPEIVTAIHTYLNPARERTVPELFVEGIGPGWREELI
jgi:hypothetical protein